MAPHFRIERSLRRTGLRWVAGIDEAGRGPLAGPVAAAAVVLDPRNLPEGLDDSKVLSAARREELYASIMARAAAVAIGFASVGEIDAINIRQATFAAMRRAVRALWRMPDYVLVDGNDFPAPMPCPGHTIVKGDGTSVSVAAASIVAKVARDRLMCRVDAELPRYGFAAHKGYATAEHRQAIARHGPSILHRSLFVASLCAASVEPESEAADPARA